jgi:hypothetical protein
LHGLQSRKAVSIIKEHQVTVLIFSGRDFSLGVTERAKQELFLIHATQNTACAERGHSPVVAIATSRHSPVIFATGEGATQYGDCAEPETCNPPLGVGSSLRHT